MGADTIAAIATGLSNAGISIIRVSGETAIETVNQIFCPKKENFHLNDAKTHTIHYGVIKSEHAPRGSRPRPASYIPLR